MPGIVEVSKQTTLADRLRYGHTAVGTTRVPLCAAGIATKQGVLVRCPGADDVDGSDNPIGNDGVVYIGDYRVTADQTETGGFPLTPGTGLMIPVEDPSSLYIISDKINQDIAWMGL